MTILVDECVDKAIVDRLRGEGHSVEWIAEKSASSPDADVLTMANDRHALLITADKDFGHLVYHHKRDHHGILLLRLADIQLDERVRYVSEIIHTHGLRLQSAFTVAKPDGLRMRS